MASVNINLISKRTNQTSYCSRCYEFTHVERNIYEGPGSLYIGEVSIKDTTDDSKLYAHGAGTIIHDNLYLAGIFQYGYFKHGVQSVKDRFIKQGSFIKGIGLTGIDCLWYDIPNGTTIVGKYIDDLPIKFKSYKDGKLISSSANCYRGTKLKKCKFTEYQLYDDFVKVTTTMINYIHDTLDDVISTDVIDVGKYNDMCSVYELPSVNHGHTDVKKQIIANILADISGEMCSDVRSVIMQYVSNVEIDSK